MPKILFTSDNHLRERQFSSPSRGEDFNRAFGQVVDIAINTKVSAILQGGDLLDSSKPSSKIMLDLARHHNRLVKAGIPMIVVNGDHDKATPHWIDSMKEFGAEVGTIKDGGIFVLTNELVTIPGTSLTVYGLDYIGKTKERFMEIRDTLPKADILLWHTMVKEFAGFFGEQAVSLEELPTNGYRLIALGDIHVCEYKRRGDCLIGYPGPTELCKRDESLVKTISLFDIPDSGPIPEPQLLPILTRPVKVYRLMKDEDVVRVLTELEGIADQYPIVLGRYDARIPDVVARIYAKLDADKCIIRLQPLPQIDIPDMPDNTPQEERDLLSFLPEFIPTVSPLYDVATAILRPEAPVMAILTDFVDKRLASIGAPTSPL
jgi:DNA repair protein SbcD/Mre11